MIIFLVAGTILFLIGCWRLTNWARSNRSEKIHWLAVIRVSAECAGWFAGAMLMISVALSAQPVDGVIAWLRFWLLWCCLGAAGVAGAAARALRAFSASGAPSFGRFAMDRIAEELRRGLLAVGRGYESIAPRGAREIQLGFLALERLIAPGAVMRGYLLSLLLVPVLMAVAFTAVMNKGTALERRVMGIVVGYNTLATASWMTVAMIIVMVIAALAVYARVLLIDLDMKRVFRAVAVWTGYGTAAGFIAGALLPVVMRIMPSTYSTPTAAEAVLSPQLLVDVPAAGAIAGYGFGIIVAAATLCRDARNLVLRRIVAPVLLLAVLFGLTRLDLGPRSIMRDMLGPAPLLGLDACTETTLESHAGDSVRVMQTLRVCSHDGAVVDDRVMLWIVGSLLVAAALAMFVSDFRCRYDAASKG